MPGAEDPSALAPARKLSAAARAGSNTSTAQAAAAAAASFSRSARCVAVESRNLSRHPNARSSRAHRRAWRRARRHVSALVASTASRRSASRSTAGRSSRAAALGREAPAPLAAVPTSLFRSLFKARAAPRAAPGFPFDEPSSVPPTQSNPRARGTRPTRGTRWLAPRRARLPPPSSPRRARARAPAPRPPCRPRACGARARARAHPRADPRRTSTGTAARGRRRACEHLAGGRSRGVEDLEVPAYAPGVVRVDLRRGRGSTARSLSCAARASSAAAADVSSADASSAAAAAASASASFPSRSSSGVAAGSAATPRLVVQQRARHERAEVVVAPPDQERNLASREHVLYRGKRHVSKLPHVDAGVFGVRPSRGRGVDDAEHVVGDTPLFLFRDLRRGDGEPLVHLHGVAVDHLAIDSQGELHRELGLAGARLPQDARHIAQWAAFFHDRWARTRSPGFPDDRHCSTVDGHPSHPSRRRGLRAAVCGGRRRGDRFASRAFGIGRKPFFRETPREKANPY